MQLMAVVVLGVARDIGTKKGCRDTFDYNYVIPALCKNVCYSRVILHYQNIPTFWKLGVEQKVAYRYGIFSSIRNHDEKVGC